MILISERIKKLLIITDGLGVDKTFVTCVIILLSIGLVMITSATLDQAYQKLNNPFHFTIKHSIYLVLGIFTVYITSQIKLKFYQDYSKLFLVLAFIFCILVFIPGLGFEAKGARRWINLGIITVQVSEVSRLFILIWVSSYILRNNIDEIFYKSVIIILLLSSIIILQRDFGSMFLLILTFFSLMLLGGVNFKKWFSTAIILIIPIALLVILTPYRFRRIMSFIDPWQDSSGAGYQLIASELAFSSGGLFGLGLGSSIQKLNYLPEAYNDFIFAVIAEELGLLFVILVILTYIIMIMRIFILAHKSADNGLLFGSFLANMIGLLITFQVIIHMMVNIGLAPTKGMGLPLISYGGTNLLCIFMCIGILIRIQIENKQKISQAVQRGY
ncbi:MAG: putative lipid II flippase FtsW [Gammaproteobacteria bacterium]|nr:putative lipid II flippase FtsW [Gammaproteobacteria bacterium]|tara:strand:+ start:20901 stop:22061 length:1161 start_codon:yes stop_codon:yes gene_type:complete